MKKYVKGKCFVCGVTLGCVKRGAWKDYKGQRYWAHNRCKGLK